jgi:hypothetical protein
MSSVLRLSLKTHKFLKSLSFLHPYAKFGDWHNNLQFTPIKVVKNQKIYNLKNP